MEKGMVSIARYMPYYGRLLKLAVPLVLTQAGQMSVQLIDNAMIGHYGTVELAAASFANSLYVVIMLLGLGVFMGITPLIGHSLGAKDESGVASTMKSGFVLSLFLIPGITLLSWAITRVMPYMGQTEEVTRLAVPYYNTLVVAVIPFLFFILLKQIGEGLGNTLVAMCATILSNILNVLMNYILIFGKFGFPELGLLGAGYATLISRMTMPLILYFAFMRLPSIRCYFVLMRSSRSAFHEIRKILRIGFPIAVQMVIEVTAFSVSAVMMGWKGNVALASHQIAMGLATFTFMIANGVAMATTIRVSFQLGKRDFESMERVGYSAVHLVLAYMTVCGALFYLLRYQLPRVFTGDSKVIEQTSILLGVAALFQLFDGLQVVCLGILRGFADVKIPMAVAAFSYLAIGLTVSYLCAFVLGMGPTGIWYGFVVGLIFAGGLLALRIRLKIRETERRI